MKLFGKFYIYFIIIYGWVGIDIKGKAEVGFEKAQIWVLTCFACFNGT